MNIDLKGNIGRIKERFALLSRSVCYVSIARLLCKRYEANDSVNGSKKRSLVKIERAEQTTLQTERTSSRSLHKSLDENSSCR